MSYRDELQFVIESDNSIFPDFLFTPVFNDFGDEYYKISTSKDIHVIEAQKIRRKYRNYFDYLNALALYDDYMNYLIDKYGSASIIKNSVKVGLFDDFIPPRPKLKKNRRNKEFLKAKVVPSRQIKMEIDEDELREIANEIIPVNVKESGITEDSSYNKLDKRTKKAAKRALEKLSGQDRRSNLYRTTGNNNGVDFIIEYVNQVSKGGYYDEKGTHHEYSITEILKEERDKQGIPEEIIEDEMTANTSVIMGDRMVYRKEKQRIDIMTDLYKMGIDLLDNSKNMDRKVVKMIRMSGRNSDEFYDDPAYMNKKELKKYKKKKKKEEQTLLMRRDQDKVLEETLLRNKYSFSDNGSNISFRLRDLYKDD